MTVKVGRENGGSDARRTAATTQLTTGPGGTPVTLAVVTRPVLANTMFTVAVPPWPVPHEAGPERWMADAGEPVETDPHREMSPEDETERA